MNGAAITGLDWAIIGAFLIISLLIGLKYRKEGSKDVSAFFLGGRNLPWYLVGLSMVATTFAADTPLAVSDLVGNNGISSNWVWWAFLVGGLLTTFFFAHLWRRANILTELEFIDLRYAGKPARFLRLFKAGYLGFLMNVMVIAWVNSAMIDLLEVFFNISGGPAYLTVGGITLIALIYAGLSGLKGVIITDAFQFVLAMGGCIILAYVVLNSDQVGGMDQLLAKVPEGYLQFFPKPASENSNLSGTLTLSIGGMLAFVGVQWWASWYPGAEPGGGGYIAQRMMSAKDEKHALFATLFFQLAHYCLRPWPWIIVGLCAISLYNPELNIENEQLLERLNTDISGLAEVKGTTAEGIIFSEFPDLTAAEKDMVVYHYSKGKGFVLAMNNFLPSGLKGLLLAAFLAAFMSTISTQLNWGASFLTNDLLFVLKPALAKGSGGVVASRIITLLIAICGVIASTFVTSIAGVWEILMGCGAGLGLVLILRWYYWRINVWAEIAATVAPLVVFPIVHLLIKDQSMTDQRVPFFITVAATTIVWVVIMFLTKPEPEEKLKAFYKRTRPGGWWKPVTGGLELNGLIWPLLCWILSVVAVYSLLFSIGHFLLHNPSSGLLTGGIGVIAVVLLIWSIPKLLNHRNDQ